MPKKKKESRERDSQIAEPKSQLAEAQGDDDQRAAGPKKEYSADEEQRDAEKPSKSQDRELQGDTTEASSTSTEASEAAMQASAGRLNEAQEQVEEKKRALAQHLGEARDDVLAVWGDLKALLEAEKNLVESQIAEAKCGAVSSLQESRRVMSEKLHQLAEQAKQRMRSQRTVSARQEVPEKSPAA